MDSRLVHAGGALAGLKVLRYVPLIGLLALVLALAAAGVLQAAAGISDALRDGLSFGVAQPIPTGYGALTVAQVEVMDGLTSQDLSGVTHGIQNLVLSQNVQLQITLQFVNRSDRPSALSPDQFRLASAVNAEGLAPTSGTLQTGSLPAGASLDANLSFVTPRTSQPLWVVYREPGRLQPVRVPVGSADPNADPNVPPPAEPSHAHQ